MVWSRFQLFKHVKRSASAVLRGSLGFWAKAHRQTCLLWRMFWSFRSTHNQSTLSTWTMIDLSLPMKSAYSSAAGMSDIGDSHTQATKAVSQNEKERQKAKASLPFPHARFHTPRSHKSCGKARCPLCVKWVSTRQRFVHPFVADVQPHMVQGAATWTLLTKLVCVQVVRRDRRVGVTTSHFFERSPVEVFGPCVWLCAFFVCFVVMPCHGEPLIPGPVWPHVSLSRNPWHEWGTITFTQTKRWRFGRFVLACVGEFVCVFASSFQPGKLDTFYSFAWLSHLTVAPEKKTPGRESVGGRLTSGKILCFAGCQAPRRHANIYDNGEALPPSWADGVVWI